MAYAPKIATGIDAVDETWGGLYHGGSYLIYGRAVSGRGLLPILFVRSAADDGASCLYMTSDSASNLAARARSVGFDIDASTRSGRLDITRMPELGGPDAVNDQSLARALLSLVATVEEKRPRRVIIDDFMPFVAFRSFGRFRTSFISLLERIDAVDATLMLVMAEPANEESEKVIEFMRSQMTAAVHVEVADQNGDTPTRKLTLIPNIGHSGQAAVKHWRVEETAPSGPDPSAESQARRYRFSGEQEEALSPRDARWDAVDDGGNHSDGKRIDAPSGGPARVTPYRLGRLEADAQRSQPSAAFSRPERSESVVTAIPLGRPRNRRASTPHTPPAISLGSSERAVGHGEQTPELRRSTQGPTQAPTRSAPPAVGPVSRTDRDGFRSRLQQHFLRSGVNEVPFLLIAMRMERRDEGAARPFDFEFILDIVSELLREQDDVYVDLERERLVVVLAGTEEDGSRRFFAELRRRLREEAPHQADHLLQSVSAIVVPNGRPFQNAEEFLSYALDEA